MIDSLVVIWIVAAKDYKRENAPPNDIAIAAGIEIEITNDHGQGLVAGALILAEMRLVADIAEIGRGLGRLRGDDPRHDESRAL